MHQSTDALIIGAGPVGLFAVFELGLMGVSAHLIDTLDKPGGQCAQLYPEKPIYDIPGIPYITAQGLVDNLMAQIKPFSPVFHLQQTVASMEKTSLGESFRVVTKDGSIFEAKTLIIATGGGNFEPKKPPIPHLEDFEGKSVFYSVQKRDVFTHKKVVIAGGGDSSLDWVLSLSSTAQKIILVHRREDFRASEHTVQQVKELVAKGIVDLFVGDVKAVEGHDGLMTHATILEKTGATHRVPADAFLPFFGLTMKPGPISTFGFEMEQDLICVNTENFETSIPRVFAIGDINTYPGKLKLILSGFHESALMAQKVFAYLFPDKRQPFQYTTSSSLLQRRLGVKA